ncbi:MAG: family 20 glycosylhydrolase [Bacteroidales bacterium]|nr:family 20 glycosylhydrolase [Bacteroidales bacterium]
MKKTTIILILIFASQLIRAQIDFIPKPQEVIYSEGTFNITKEFSISTVGGEEFNIKYLKEHLDKIFDFKINTLDIIPKNNFLIFDTSDQSMGKEEYTLKINEKGIIVKAKTKAGQFYAIQTLLQMFPADIYADITGPSRMLLKEWNLPQITINDYPRFEYRGNMLDVSRTFFGKEYILRHLEWLAYHKINKFHMHLSDDNGWRVEIKKYPLLTQVGAWRGENEALVPSFDSGQGRYGGYYTREDIKEIVEFAADRNIEIIPEIDLPGHSKAVTVSYPEVLCNTKKEFLSVQGEGSNVWCVSKESNYKMLENIIKEISKLFPSEYIHIGGDEVVTNAWKECPDCQALMEKEGMKNEGELLNYFVRRMEKILNKYGKKLAGWDEISVDGDLNKNSHVYTWRGVKTAQDAVKKGMPVIMQIGEYCYIDMKYSPMERGHNWAGIVSMEKIYSFDPIGSLGITKEQEKSVIGVQAGLWSEMMIFPPHFSEYQMFPRLCALSEIGWTNQEIRDYKEFDKRLWNSHFERMYKMGILFRLPYPEITKEGNTVFVKSPSPSAVVRYTFDESEPNMGSPVAQSTIITDSPEKLRFATFFGTNKSITVEVPGSKQYLKPKVIVTSSMDENPRAKMSNLEDYNINTYFRTASAPQKGDWILFSFEEPVDCREITVNTTIPVIEFWGISDGHVEYSYNGEDFIIGGKFKRYSVKLSKLDSPVKAIKIVVDSKGEGKPIAVQDLKIQ